MEGLINPNQSDLKNIHYFLWLDELICCVEGIWYIEHEETNFGIENKIQRLDEIINHIVYALDNISYDDKPNLIKTIRTKQNSLSDLLKRYREIKQKYIDFDFYYREKLFEEYKTKYFNASFFVFTEKKLCMSVMNDIKICLKKKFDDFLLNYFDLRNSFFDINNYILKIKKLFNIIII